MQCSNERKPSWACLLSLVPQRPGCRATLLILIWGKARYSASEGMRVPSQLSEGHGGWGDCEFRVYKRNHIYLVWLSQKGFLGMNRIRFIQPCSHDCSVNWQSMASAGTREDCFKIGEGRWGWWVKLKHMKSYLNTLGHKCNTGTLNISFMRKTEKDSGCSSMVDCLPSVPKSLWLGELEIFVSRSKMMLGDF